MTKTVLFLCSGNYYRSRYAEKLFNHHAAQQGLNWRADSRGLIVTTATNLGPISPHTVIGVRKHGLVIEAGERYPTQLAQGDLDSAELTIALKEAEHRTMMREQFPTHENGITYWHVHDLDAATPVEALTAIETLVVSLLEQFTAQQA